MGPKTIKLVNLLDSMSSALRSCGEEHWSIWLEKDAALLRTSDFEGIEHFLRAFGGMGSINDLVLHPMNGHKFDGTDVAKINESFQSLLTEAWELAREVRNEAVVQ